MDQEINANVLAGKLSGLLTLIVILINHLENNHVVPRGSTGQAIQKAINHRPHGKIQEASKATLEMCIKGLECVAEDLPSDLQ